MNSGLAINKRKLQTSTFILLIKLQLDRSETRSLRIFIRQIYRRHSNTLIFKTIPPSQSRTRYAQGSFTLGRPDCSVLQSSTHSATSFCSTLLLQLLVLSQTLKRFIERHFTIFNIILFEFLGTWFFAYGVLVAINTDFILAPLDGVFSSIFISLTLFMAIVWGGSFTGGHFNPAVTLGFMLKRQNRLPWTKGLLYIVAQICGAWMGALVAWLSSDIYDAPLIGNIGWVQAAFSFLAQTVGTFIFVFFIMVATTSDTTFCKDTSQVYVFIPLTLMLAREYSYRSQGLNPAFGFAFQFFWCAYKNEWYLFKYVWATFFGPFVGSAIAVLFFEGFYRKFIVIYKRRKTIVFEEKYFRPKQVEYFL